MRGHEAIVKARRRGYKPAKWVWVDVGSNTAWQSLLGRYSGSEVAPGVPDKTYVCLEPFESSRTADWSWAVGLKVHVDGDDEARLMAAAEGIKAAGAVRVVALMCDRFLEVSS